MLRRATHTYPFRDPLPLSSVASGKTGRSPFESRSSWRIFRWIPPGEWDCLKGASAPKPPTPVAQSFGWDLQPHASGIYHGFFLQETVSNRGPLEEIGPKTGPNLGDHVPSSTGPFVPWPIRKLVWFHVGRLPEILSPHIPEPPKHRGLSFFQKQGKAKKKKTEPRNSRPRGFTPRLSTQIGQACLDWRTFRAEFGFEFWPGECRPQNN